MEASWLDHVLQMVPDSLKVSCIEILAWSSIVLRIYVLFLCIVSITEECCKDSSQVQMTLGRQDEVVSMAG